MKSGPGNKLQGDLRGADFSGQDLSGRVFSQADLYEASFAGASLKGAEFLNCTAERANFEGAQCQRMQALNTNFYGANFAGADLSDSLLRYCVLARANLNDAILERVTVTLNCNTFERAQLDHESAARLAFLFSRAETPLRLRIRQVLGEREFQRLERIFAE